MRDLLSHEPYIPSVTCDVTHSIDMTPSHVSALIHVYHDSFMHRMTHLSLLLKKKQHESTHQKTYFCSHAYICMLARILFLCEFFSLTLWIFFPDTIWVQMMWASLICDVTHSCWLCEFPPHWGGLCFRWFNLKRFQEQISVKCHVRIQINFITWRFVESVPSASWDRITPTKYPLGEGVGLWSKCHVTNSPLLVVK